MNREFHHFDPSEAKACRFARTNERWSGETAARPRRPPGSTTHQSPSHSRCRGARSAIAPDRSSSRTHVFSELSGP